MKDIIQTPHAPAAIGTYSQAVRQNGFLFISGQLGIDPQTGVLQEGLEAQARRCMENLKAILEAAGLDFSHLVKVSIFLMDMGDFAAVNGLYESYLSAPYPAREAVQVAALPKGGLVEISAIACES